jgi:ribosomal-protein-alanine N-acetyltransferase
MVPVKSFETKRLILKPLSLGDIPSYETHFVDYEVIRHLSAVVPWPYPRNAVREFFQNVLLPPQGISRWSWGIFLKDSPTEVIGCIELWRPGTPENRGFWLARQHWGRGLMGEAVQPVVGFAFKDLGFEKLVLTNAVGNERSRRIKEKTGARLIDVRPAKFVDPSYSEHEIWELKKSGWMSGEPSVETGNKGQVKCREPE